MTTPTLIRITAPPLTRCTVRMAPMAGPELTAFRRAETVWSAAHPGTGPLAARTRQ